MPHPLVELMLPEIFAKNQQREQVTDGGGVYGSEPGRGRFIFPSTNANQMPMRNEANNDIPNWMSELWEEEERDPEAFKQTLPYVLQLLGRMGRQYKS